MCDRDWVEIQMTGEGMAIKSANVDQLVSSWSMPHRAVWPSVAESCHFWETGSLNLYMGYLNFKIYLCIRGNSRDTSWAQSLNPSHWHVEDKGRPVLWIRIQDRRDWTKWEKWACLCRITKHWGRRRKERVYPCSFVQWIRKEGGAGATEIVLF